MRRVLTFMAGLLTGGGIGAIISILYAPASGEEVRTGIKQRFNLIKHNSEVAAERKEAELRAELATLTEPEGQQV